MCILAFLCIGGLTVGPAHADQSNEIRIAQHIVVITPDEGIHYARFYGFYELREILSESIADLSEALTTAGSPLFEVRAIGTDSELTAHIGDHWISTEDGVAILSPPVFKRLIELIEKRKGHGVPLPDLEASIQHAADQIRDPAYVEQDMCDSR